MLYALIHLVSRIVYRMPQPLQRALGKLLGRLCWLAVPGRRRKLAYGNIMTSLKTGSAQARHIAKRSVTRFGPMFVEVMCMPYHTQESVERLVALEGAEHLTHALSYGRGVVLATAHTGNWELLGNMLALHRFPLVAVVQKQTNAAADRFINEYRTLAGMHVTYKTSVREMIRLLKQGRIIGLLMDQDASQNGVFVDFFGRPASTPTGAAALARLQDAPIVPAFLSGGELGRHVARIYPPVWVNKSADRDRDVAETTQKLTTIIEDHIRQAPEEWFWLHNRWKTRPVAR